jgi:hypothetical protein
MSAKNIEIKRETASFYFEKQHLSGALLVCMYHLLLNRNLSGK